MGEMGSGSSANLKQGRMSDSIRVIVCIPSISIRRELIVNRKMIIQDLKRFLPNPDCDLVYAGSMLMETMPLAFYSVNDGDFMVALSRSHESSTIWVQMTQDNEAFSERMRTIMDPKLSSEYARIKDLKIMRCAERPSVLAKLEAMSSAIEEKGACFKKEVSVISETGDGPNCDALPVPWAVKSNSTKRTSIAPRTFMRSIKSIRRL